MDFKNDDPSLIEERFLDQRLELVTTFDYTGDERNRVAREFFDFPEGNPNSGECASWPAVADCELEAVLESE